MKTQSDYRKLAEDCVRLAQTATEVHRTVLLNMAHIWCNSRTGWLATINGWPTDTTRVAIRFDAVQAGLAQGSKLPEHRQRYLC
jgi:hypothetical protein